MSADQETPTKTGRLLCFFGLHNWVFKSAYFPSIHADVVTDIIHFSGCSRCKKVKNYTHLNLGGAETVDADAG